LQHEFVIRSEDGRWTATFSSNTADAVALDLAGARAEPRPLRLLRPPDTHSGLCVVLWGEEVICGVLQVLDGDLLACATTAADRSGAGANPLALAPLTMRVRPAAVDRMAQTAAAAAQHSGPLAITCPIPGLIKQVNVKAGQAVEAAETLLVLEAMKMENEIDAPHAGTIKQVNVQPGQVVAAGEVLVELELG